MELLGKFSGTARYWDGDEVLFSRGRDVFRVGRSQSTESENPSSVPLSSLNRVLSLFRVLRRLTRREIHHLRRLPCGKLLAIGFGSIYVQKEGQNWRCTAPLAGRRPLIIATTLDGGIFYGEYRDNPERSPVAIWGSEDAGERWRTAWTFTGVRHVHGVFHDPFDEALWVTTGDCDKESGIWRTRDRFRTLEMILGGTQEFRVVQLLFTPNAVLFGSDAPDDANYLYRLDRRSGRVARTQGVGGPIFYGTRSGLWTFFSTSVEPSRINTSRGAEVWASRDDGRTWTRAFTFKKDGLPSKLFQYGQVLFPAGPGCPGRLWLTPFATQWDQTSFCYELPA